MLFASRRNRRAGLGGLSVHGKGEGVIHLIAQMVPGLEYALLAVGMLVLAVLGSLLALVVAFFNRKFAILLSVLATSATVLWVLLALVANAGSLFLLRYRLSFVWPSALLAGGAILLSGVAALVPLVRDKTHTHTTQKITSNRLLVFSIIIVPLLVLAGLGGRQLIEWRVGEQKTKALLSGDTQVRVEYLQIDLQVRRVICTDPVTLQYLENQFRASRPNRDIAGITYKLSLWYEGGGSHSIPAEWIGNGLSLTPSGRGDGGVSYIVSFTRPLPPTVEVIASFLDRPWQEVEGTILRIDHHGISYESDSTLTEINRSQ